MARGVRIEYPEAFYHVMARGNRREAIFRDNADRQLFLKTLGEACAMTGWRIRAWLLMSNHYHLLIETPEANLVAGMQSLQNTYTRRFNRQHRYWGRLFGDLARCLTDLAQATPCNAIRLCDNGAKLPFGFCGGAFCGGEHLTSR
jgi:REP element-mobilizing transposase RayT